MTVREWMTERGKSFGTREEAVQACVSELSVGRAVAFRRYNEVVSSPSPPRDVARTPKKSRGITVSELIEKLDVPSRIRTSAESLGDRMLTDEELRAEFMPDVSKAKFMTVVRHHVFAENRIQSESTWYWGTAQSCDLIREHINAF